jgi:hypothetical protein
MPFENGASRLDVQAVRHNKKNASYDRHMTAPFVQSMPCRRGPALLTYDERSIPCVGLVACTGFVSVAPGSRSQPLRRRRRETYARCSQRCRSIPRRDEISLRYRDRCRRSNPATLFTNRACVYGFVIIHGGRACRLAMGRRSLRRETAHGLPSQRSMIREYGPRSSAGSTTAIHDTHRRQPLIVTSCELLTCSRPGRPP